MAKETFIEITNKDVYDELKKQGKIQDKILKHAEYTNGKVAENLERIESVANKSLGVWISRHPLKFTIFVLIFATVVVSDLRDPLITFLLKLI